MVLFPPFRSVLLLDLPWQYLRSTYIPRCCLWSYLSFLQWRAQSLPCLSVLKLPSPGTWGGARGQTGRWLLSVSGLSVEIQLAAVRSDKTEAWAGSRVCAWLIPVTSPTPAVYGEMGDVGVSCGLGLWHIFEAPPALTFCAETGAPGELRQNTHGCSGLSPAAAF